jgi:hypothetical protein
VTAGLSCVGSAAQPNELWQADVTHRHLADGIEAEILNLTFPHPRMTIRSARLFCQRHTYRTNLKCLCCRASSDCRAGEHVERGEQDGGGGGVSALTTTSPPRVGGTSAGRRRRRAPWLP